MKRLSHEEVVLPALATTEEGTTIEATVRWLDWEIRKGYHVFLHVKRTNGGLNHQIPPIPLERDGRYSFKKIQAVADGCLLRDDVRNVIHQICSEQGLTLANPVF